MGRCFQVVKLSVPKGLKEQDQCSSSEDDGDFEHHRVLFYITLRCKDKPQQQERGQHEEEQLQPDLPVIYDPSRSIMPADAGRVRLRDLRGLRPSKLEYPWLAMPRWTMREGRKGGQ